jgi:hypothetical protein
MLLNLKLDLRSLQLLTGMDGPYDPVGIWANLIVVVQGFLSLLLTALLTVWMLPRFILT